MNSRHGQGPGQRDTFACELRIGWSISGGVEAVAGPSCNHVHGGPEVLLGWLESQLGLSAEPRPWTGRVTEYAALLEQVGDTAYTMSLETDRWATAVELLRRRDDLRLAGWDGSGLEELPRLVRDLAHAEVGPRRVRPGVAERLTAVLATLDAGQVLPPHHLLLDEDSSEWPVLWRRVLDRLHLQTAEPSPPRAPEDTALGLVQRALAAEETVASETDASLRWVAAESRLAACEAVARALATEPEALASTVVLCEAADATVLFDACLARVGLPTMGGARKTRAIPAFQVLPLVLQLCWKPVDPETLLAFVSLPVGPVPRRAGRRLAEALAEQPGLASRAWEEAVAGLCSPENDPEGRLAKRLETWLEHERVARGEPLPPSLIRERCGLVARWAVGRAEAPTPEAIRAIDVESLHALAGQASGLADLASSHGGPVSESQIARLLDAVRLDGLPSCSRPEADGGPVHVTSLADIVRPVERLVWLGLSTGDPIESAWTVEDLAELRERGIDLDDGSRELALRRSAERRGLLCVRERLLAVGLPDDEKHRPHPLWQQIQEGLNAGGEPLRRGVPLRRVISGDRAADVAPWEFTTSVQLVEPPPGRRPLWVVPHGLLRERKASSASSLEARLACPLKWVLHYQAHLHPSPVAELPADFRLRGSFCHALLAEVFGQEGSCPATDECVAQIGRLFDERLPHDAAPIAQPTHLVVRRQVRDELLAATRLLVETLRKGDYQLKGAEVPVEGEIQGRALRGSIDCLVGREDGSEAVIDYKYGGRRKYPRLLEEGRALQLATYATARRHQSGGADVRVAYLLISDCTVHTPEGSPLEGSTTRDTVQGAPSIHDVWSRFTQALDSADEWLSGAQPVPARPLQDPEDWPPGAEIALDPDPRVENQAVCKYCDYGVLCGRERLE